MTDSKEMFGYELADLPNFTEWVIGTTNGGAPGGMALDWRAAFDRTGNGNMTAEPCTVMCRDGTNREIRLRGVRLHDDNYFVMVHRA